ncbi:MAG: 50S ribosomal protein L6 [Thermaerobacterales bacterium]
MSRVGKNPVAIPGGVDIKVEQDNQVSVKGPKGELTRRLTPILLIHVEDGVVRVDRKNDNRQSRSLHGLTRTLIANMVTGVTEGYSKTLVLEGVGYRANLQGRKLVMSLGFSHPVEFELPDGIDVEVPQPTSIIVRGIDKELVGNIAATLRAKRPISSYKYADGARGIRYADERVNLKPVKAGK